MRGGRQLAVLVLLVAGGLTCWWASRASAPHPGPVGERNGPVAAESIEPQLEGMGKGPKERRGAEAESEGATPEGDSKMAAVECRVVDERGDSVAGARVRVRKIEQGATYLIISGDRELVTGSGGAISCEMPAGEEREVMVLASATHSASQPRIVKSDAEDLKLAVAREPNLTGVVLDEHGVAMEGARITVTGAKWLLDASALDRKRREIIEVTTDANGRFAARLSPRDEPVHVRIRPSEARETELLYEEREKILLGNTTLRVRFPVPVFIEGDVVDAAGNPVGACTLGTMPAGNDFDSRGVGKSATVDPHTGRFRIGPLPAGDYSVYATFKDRLIKVAPIRVRAPARDVRFVSPTLGIGGVIVGFKELGVQTGGVLCRPMESAPDAGVQRAEVTGSGRFWIPCSRDVPYRLYALLVGDKEWWCAELEGVRPGSGLEIRPQRGLSISGTYAGWESKGRYSVLARRDGFHIAGSMDDGGRFEVRPLTPGKWTVVVHQWSRGGGFEILAEEQVEAGTADLEL